MKKHAKHIGLYPFSLVYRIITGIRNSLFENEILPSREFNLPIICVGNLSVGGTGKTPHTEFILSVLQDQWKTAMLSRGYKRKTRGFMLADENATSLVIGDEPYQIFRKFPKVLVAVDEKRVRGTEKLLSLYPDLQALVLDDAFQHRHIQAGFSILLTDYGNLYTRDFLLPAGTLRESHHGSKRANLIVVTKCPTNINAMEMRLIEMELNPENNQQVFFSTYSYETIVPVFPEYSTENAINNTTDLTGKDILLVAGIVSPKAIVEYLGAFSQHIETLFFPDHHAFQSKDFIQIKKRFGELSPENKLLLVTEKDAARIQSNPQFPDELKPYTYALPIKVRILHDQETAFIQKIKNYVVETSRNH